MANLARWEPRHGRFRFRHPWKQYLEVGTLTRQCAFKIEALNNYITSEIQTPQEVKSIIQRPSTRKFLRLCIKLASEANFKDVKPRVTPDQENYVNNGPHHVITVQG
ncbi:hypothetical protein M0R45_015870 [Rubus argutus]|uniref:Uncharacterized protein n=1 Tax=Rubus argutus TaxID=59490 RepID=A0AAW1XTG5_RUBAR